jgi:hypothetical protein
MLKIQMTKTKKIVSILIFEFWICFACLREAAPAKAGISIFEFRILRGLDA